MFLEKIIAGPIKNLTDARYFAARGVRAVYFDIRPYSPDYIPEYEAIAIKEWIDVNNIGFVMPGQNTEEDLLIAENLNLDFIVWTDAYLTFDIPAKSAIEVYWKGGINSLSSESAAELLSKFDKLIIENPDETSLKNILSDERLLLDCYIMAQNSLDEKESIISWVSKGGSLCLAGGEEEKVGLKSFDELDDIIDLLEEM